MKRIQKFHVRFWLNHRRQKDGQATLYYCITVDGLRAEGATTHSIKKEHWNEAQGRLKNNAPHNIQGTATLQLKAHDLTMETILFLVSVIIYP